MIVYFFFKKKNFLKIKFSVTYLEKEAKAGLDELGMHVSLEMP